MGRDGNPDNYHRIHLLSTISNLYAYHLNSQLQDWIEKESMLGNKQVHFSLNHFTLDHILIQQYLIGKHIYRNRSAKLFVIIPVALYIKMWLSFH